MSCACFTSLRDAIRRREIWVQGSRRWRDPETDLPTAFINKLRADLDQALVRLSGALQQNAAGGVRITTRKGEVFLS